LERGVGGKGSHTENKQKGRGKKKKPGEGNRGNGEKKGTKGELSGAGESEQQKNVVLSSQGETTQ